MPIPIHQSPVGIPYTPNLTAYTNTHANSRVKEAFNQVQFEVNKTTHSDGVFISFSVGSLVFFFFFFFVQRIWKKGKEKPNEIHPRTHNTRKRNGFELLFPLND